MQFWVVKAEPSDWSIDQHADVSVESWTGVRNYEARNNIGKMKLGDTVFFYRSLHSPAVVGILEVVSLAYPDPTDNSGKFLAIDLKYLSHLTEPVFLSSIKKEPSLANIGLVKRSRLSVFPIAGIEFSKLIDMSSTDFNVGVETRAG